MDNSTALWNLAVGKRAFYQQFKITSTQTGQREYCISNRQFGEAEAIREQYGQMAGSLKAFDALMDKAIGPNSEPYSFLLIRTDAKDPKRAFMLRFEAWLEPVAEQ